MQPAFVLFGTAAGTVARWWNTRSGVQIAALQRSVADLESQLRESAARLDARLAAVESRLDDHENRLQALPSAAEITAAVEAILATSMESIEKRFAEQTDAIELLKITVSQTDSLLERVLESLDAFAHTGR